MPENDNVPKNETKKDKKWKLAANAQYQDAMKIVVNLATASLVLPIVLIKDFLPQGAVIGAHLNKWAFRSWWLLFGSILLFMLFIYASAKYVKVVSGGEEKRLRLLGFFYDVFTRFFNRFRKSTGEPKDKEGSMSPEAAATAMKEKERDYSERVFEGTRGFAIFFSIACFMVGLICLGMFFATLR